MALLLSDDSFTPLSSPQDMGAALVGVEVSVPVRLTAPGEPSDVTVGTASVDVGALVSQVGALIRASGTRQRSARFVFAVTPAVAGLLSLTLTVPTSAGDISGTFTWTVAAAAPPPPPPPPPPPAGPPPLLPLPVTALPPLAGAPALYVLPDGSVPVVERLEFLTDIRTSLSGQEFLAPLRAVPQVTFTGTYFATASLAGTGYASNANRAAILAALRTGFVVELPVACHSVLPGDDPLAGYTGPTGRVWRHAVGFVGPWVDAAATATPEGWRVDYPLRAGWLQEAREIEHLSPVVSRFSLTFRCKPPVVEQYASPPTAEPALRHNWVATVTEVVTSTQDVFDNGHIPIIEQRYLKRRVQVELALRGRTEISEFRRFLVAGTCGPAHSFGWTCPGDAAPAIWRFTSDAFEIEYLSRLRARVKVELVQVPL